MTETPAQVLASLASNAERRGEDELSETLVEIVLDLVAAGVVTAVPPRALRARSLIAKLHERRLPMRVREAKEGDPDEEIRRLLEMIAARSMVASQTGSVSTSLSGSNPTSYRKLYHDGTSNVRSLFGRMLDVPGLEVLADTPISYGREFLPSASLGKGIPTGPRLRMGPRLNELNVSSSVLTNFRERLSTLLTESDSLGGLSWMAELDYHTFGEDTEWPRLVLHMTLPSLPLEDQLSVWDRVSDSLQEFISEQVRSDRALRHSNLGRLLKRDFFVTVDA